MVWQMASGNFHKETKQEREQEEILSRTAISARVVYEAILSEGEDELKRRSSALIFSGIAAGLSMGFSLLGQAFLQMHLPEANWRPLIVKWGYAIGFLIVVLGRQQLFTENTLTPVLSFLRHKTRRAFVNLMRLWGIVLVSNLIGAFAFACLLARTPAFAGEAQRIFEEIGREPLKLSFGVACTRGIFAGWLIALMVWLLPFAESARVWVILLLAYGVGLGELTHIIAGSVDVFYLVVAQKASWSDYLGRFMAPTLLGNIIGGVALVAVLNHGQVTAGNKK
jgi:formate/nitrite transporter FocA (FNT family)